MQIIILLQMHQQVLFSSGICNTGSDSSVMQLTSNPQDLSNIHPGDSVIFTCTTSGSAIQQWSSVDYVGDSGQLLFFGADDTPGTEQRTPNNVSIANLTMVTSNGLVLESQLRITVSSDYPISNVTCINDSQRVNVTICFSVAMGELIPRCCGVI